MFTPRKDGHSTMKRTPGVGGKMRAPMSASGEARYYFSDLDLSRRLERAEAHANAMFVEARARTSPLSGACWIEVAGAYAMFDGVGSPVTQTFGLGLFQTPTPEAFEEIERFFLLRGASVFHEVSPLAGLGVVAMLNERGYRPVELTSVMYRPLAIGGDSRVRGNERVRVRAIEKHEGDLWARTTARGWRSSIPSPSRPASSASAAESRSSAGPVPFPRPASGALKTLSSRAG
jgi:hypothetical protein